MKIGIRREDKSIWERRTPLIPSDIAELRAQGLDIVVQTSPNRIFKDEEFKATGVPLQKDLKDCDLIFGIKEIPKDAFNKDGIYLFFAHVIKGQSHNMPMLRQMMAQNVTLIDYERIMDAQGRRLIFFGHYAGLAGAINALWALGQRFDVEEIPNPFSKIKQAKDYPDLDAAKADIQAVGEDIKANGIHSAIHPLIIGLAGYGNVSKGAQEILNLLPVKYIEPEELKSVSRDILSPKNVIYIVVFKEEHCVEPKDPEAAFDLQDYYEMGQSMYKSRFEPYLRQMTMLINCVYWDERYPRLITQDECKKLWSKKKRPGLRVIADISCDIQGAVQCTVKATDPGNATYVYQPESGEIAEGFEGHGPVIMAVDILPAELPRESSIYFSSILKPFIESLALADYKKPLDKLNLPEELKQAVILYQGELTPDYENIRPFL